MKVLVDGIPEIQAFWTRKIEHVGHLKKIIFDKRSVGKWKKNLMNRIIKKSSNLTINLEETSKKKKELGLSIGFLTHFLKSTQKSDFQVLIPGPH